MRIRMLAVLAAVCATAPAMAQDYPTRPVRIIVPFPAGGVADIMARIVGQRISEGFAQPVIVDNRAGASAIIGSEMVAKATPDGYTVLLANLPVMAINSLTYDKLPYDPLRDFAPVTLLSDQPYIIAIHPGVPAKDLPAFIQLAKQKPGQFTFGSASSSTMLCGELLKLVGGFDMLHVPYKGSAPAINDLLGGQITLLIDPVITLAPHAAAGKLRALAVTASKRSNAAPQVPSYTEFGLKNLDMTSWQGIVAPAGTPRPVIDRLHAGIAKALKQPDTVDRLNKQGVTPLGQPSAEFRAFVKREFDRWSDVARRIKLERTPLSGS